MSQKQNFITTTDKETADKLISMGFQLVSTSGSVYIFLNQLPNNFSFDEVDKGKMAYTNVLSL
jgi:phosphoserine phosphatase